MARPDSRQFSDWIYENEEGKEEETAHHRNRQDGRWAKMKEITSIVHGILKTIGGKKKNQIIGRVCAESGD